MKKLVDKVQELVLERSGTLTRELLREPGGFGLGQVPSRLKPETTTTAVCGFCSTGCGLDIHLKGGTAINLSPAKDYSVNLGMACPKGWEALTPLAAKDRATHPLLKDSHGHQKKVTWETAIGTFADRIKKIQAQHGPESVAFISTGQIPFEEMALLGSLAKFEMGMLHGDGNTRQCMATGVVAYKQAFGFDAPPYTYQDFEESDVIVLAGSNLCIAHPIMWERICKNPYSPEIIVIDPRKTETAMAGTQHLPLKPKSDLVLYYAIANLLIENDWIDHEYIAEHVDGFEEYKTHVKQFSLEMAAEQTGLSPESIFRVAESIHQGKRVSLWWTMGVNQSHEGVRTAQALINIALMTGNIGRPGTGANSITGQCNAMGSRLFSNTTNLLGGHAFENELHRQKIAQILEIEEEKIPSKGGLAYDQIMEGIHRGTIKGLWVIATNTAHSWINQADAQELLKKLDFLVVQDMYTSTETAQLADLILPAAGWGEKEGCFINSERRISPLKKVCHAPGEALADFSIFRLLGKAWGAGSWIDKWDSPEAAFRLLRECTKGQPCDITGIEGYQMLDKLRGIQWPLPEGETVERRSQRRLFQDGQFYTPSGRAKLLFEMPRECAETTDDRYPLTLLTGRGTSAQWHTQTRTSKSEVLKKLYSEDPYVELNPKDARALKIHPHQWIIVESRRGKVKARAYITQICSPGQVFLPMHYAQTNQLTFPSFDPYSRQPSYKSCAVRIRTNLS
ncbi:MAG: nitrate reductase [Polyangiaceae bacterium]|nr:nitrate reductase [Polyangiaceae bacterium]